MKDIFKIFQFLLLMCGVFGADEDEVKTLSVMEGDSVTLNPDLTQIQGFILIEWRFGSQGSIIAKIVDEISYEDEEIFEDRLQLDLQTGSLTIKNMRTKHSGRYKAEINHSTGTMITKFIVTVYESPAVIDSAEGEMKLMSVKEGGPVILQTDVPQLTGDELIVWRFGDEGKLIAKHDLEAKRPPLYDETDERFRDRLQLDQTGSLTITNTRTTDSGPYTVKISSNKQTSYKRFTVTVSVPDSGYSGGAVAGIVISVLLLVAVAGVMYFCLRPTNLPSVTWTVPAGDRVTLNPDTELQRGDKILWLFGAEETLIAEIKGENREKTIYDGPDMIFMNRLKLDEMTGSLTIKFIGPEHTGHYTLKIRRGRETFYKNFIVFVRERRLVIEGNPVTLYSDTKIQKGDEIQWLFDDKEQTVLAEIKNTKVTKYDDWRFKDRLELNKKTGSLTIKNFTAAHAEFYTLKIKRGRDKIYKRFFIFIRLDENLRKVGFVTLNPDTEIQSDDQIQWMFGDQDKLIAQMKGGTVEMYDDVNERFRGRLKLDKMTGSLTITKIEAEDAGLYKLLIINSSREILCKKFTVFIQLSNVTVTAGEPVRLYTGLNEIQRDDEIEWRFGFENFLIAEIKGGTGETHDVPDERFRDRLKVDETTGDLIIKNSTAEHAGRYKLKIRSSVGKTNMSFTFTITVKDVEVTAGDSVRLYTALTEIKTDDEIEWRFGDENSLIAEIKGGTGVTHDGPDERFRDRLELDEKTGDLTIKNSTYEHAGEYKLKISSSEENTNRTYTVTIRYSRRN